MQGNLQSQRLSFGLCNGTQPLLVGPPHGFVQEHSVFKKRLSSTGEVIDDKIEEHKVGPEEDERLLHEQQAANETKPCGSCYGASTKAEDCCNTCEEVH